MSRSQVQALNPESVIWIEGDGWYCPDFYLPELDIWVEVKGVTGPEDPARWAEWRKGRRLAVISREELHVLRTRANDNVVRQQIRNWAVTSLASL